MYGLLARPVWHSGENDISKLGYDIVKRSEPHIFSPPLPSAAFVSPCSTLSALSHTSLGCPIPVRIPVHLSSGSMLWRHQRWPVLGEEVLHQAPKPCNFWGRREENIQGTRQSDEHVLYSEVPRFWQGHEYRNPWWCSLMNGSNWNSICWLCLTPWV